MIERYSISVEEYFLDVYRVLFLFLFLHHG